MKILLVYDCIYPESLGGGEYRNHCLAQALAERGHRVTVAGWVTAVPTVTDRISILPLAFRSPIHDGSGKRATVASIRFMLAVAKLDLSAYDVIETANIPYIHIFPLALRCLLSGKLLVVTWHEFFGTYWKQYQGRLLAPAYRFLEWLCAQIGQVNAPSSLTAGRLQRVRIRAGGPDIPVIPNGVWLRDIQTAVVAPATDGPILLYAGRLIPEKRIDLLLRAVAKLKRSPSITKHFLLAVVGDGPDRERLERLAVDLGVEPHIKFYGHLPDIVGVWKLIASAKIAVQPSVREGFGLFPLEAIALGIPVVTCDAPDNAVGALVRHDVEGLCCAPEPDALATTLEYLLEDQALWHRLSKAGKRRAAHYDWPAVAEQMEGFFLQFLADRRTKSFR